MKKIITIIWLITLFIQCNQTPNTQNTNSETTEKWQQLKQETLAIHDTAMKYMGELKLLKKQLQEKLNNTPDKYKEKIQTTLNQLEKADKDMWDWMHQYSKNLPDEKNTPKDSLLKFFQREKQKIIIVDKQIRTAIHNAKQILNNE